MNVPGQFVQDSPIKRYSASYLCDIMYGVEPMTREIATVVRYLRVERKLSYSEVGWILCENGADPAVCFQVGQSFSSLSAAFLHEKPDAGWL
jgi:hypothetical protein